MPDCVGVLKYGLYSVRPALPESRSFQMVLEVPKCFQMFLEYWCMTRPESHRGPTLKHRPQHRAEDIESLERLRQQISISSVHKHPYHRVVAGVYDARDRSGAECNTLYNCVEIRPLFSQTCTARIQKFPDGSGSPQMFPDVSRCFQCFQMFLDVSRILTATQSEDTESLERLSNRFPSGYGPTPTRTIAVLLRNLLCSAISVVYSSSARSL
eukprot:jgi/Chrzof1/8819/Cz03g25210.t1